MRRRRLIAAISAFSFAIAGRGAQAQRIAPVAVAAHRSVAPSRAAQDTVGDAMGPRRKHAARGVLIGAGVGTVLGLGLAAIAPTDGTGRSEKGSLFLGLGTLGAVMGGVVGAVIGALLPR